MPLASTSIDSATLEVICADIKSEIDEHSVLDSLIRELARNRLQIERLTTQLAQQDKELAAVHAFAQARDILLPQAAQAYNGRRRLSIDAGMPLTPEAGFHRLETDGLGRPFRWTGPAPEFKFSSHLDRSVALKFTLHLAMWAQERTRNLRCFCDGTEVVMSMRESQRYVEFSGVLSPRETLGPTQLTFLVDAMFRPANQPGTSDADSRTLGVVFLKIEFNEASETEIEASRIAAELQAQLQSRDERQAKAEEAGQPVKQAG